jgi:hypothetical protein
MGRRLIADDNSINTFNGKTDQIHGQVAVRGVEQGPTFQNQEITPQIPFSRCVPGPLSLRVRTSGTESTDAENYASIRSAPAYSVTKDNTGN